MKHAPIHFVEQNVLTIANKAAVKTQNVGLQVREVSTLYEFFISFYYKKNYDDLFGELNFDISIHEIF